MSDYVPDQMQVDMDFSLEDVDYVALVESLQNDPCTAISQEEWDELDKMFDQDPYWEPGAG